MKVGNNGIRDADLRQVEAALKRAAAKAQMLGKQTGTPVFVLREGKIVDLAAKAGKPKAG
jgi:protein-disulfide isomerase